MAGHYYMMFQEFIEQKKLDFENSFKQTVLRNPEQVHYEWLENVTNDKIGIPIGAIFWLLIIIAIISFVVYKSKSNRRKLIMKIYDKV